MKTIKEIEDRCEEINASIVRFIEGDNTSDKHKNEEHIELKCNNCGNIFTKRVDHLFTSYGCRNCSNTKQKLSMKEVFSKIKEKCIRKNCTFICFVDENGNETEWINSYKTRIKLQCNICNHIWTIAYNNLTSKHDYGCPQCANNLRLTKDRYLSAIDKRCKEISDTFLCFCDDNGNEIEYKNNHTKLKLVCGKCKREYIIVYENFIHMKQSCSCGIQTNAEKEISILLDNNKIEYNYKDKKILEYKRYELDFYLPKYNIGIEVQGGQHFYFVEQWGGEKSFASQQKRDNKKREICKEKGIKLLYYSDLKLNFPYEVYTDKNKLLENILKSENNIS